MVQFTPEMRSFLSEHAADDTTRLLLSASRYPGIDVRWAVEQIEARRQLRNKLPEWYAASDRLIMGGRIPAEQCSSEQTALYKQRLVKGESLCDLTGGMGVDCYYMSKGLKRAIYTERQPHLCDAARNNFPALGATHIEVREGESFQLGIPDVDTLYLDPARRGHDGSRVYDLADCEPNVVAWREELLKHCRRLVVKISPMADLTRVLEQMPGISELHIVAVRNECKEVILVLDNEVVSSPTVHCVDFRTSDVLEFSYRWEEEQQAEVSLVEDSIEAGSYLYEPDVTLLKAGAFRLPCARYGLRKLEVNSHLYVSSQLVADFPGRIFTIEQTLDFASKNIKTLRNLIPQANIATRNFPLTPDALRKKTGIRDGGQQYLYGATVREHGTLLFLCRKALLLLFLLLAPGLLFARRNKKNVAPVTLESILQGVQLESPSLWNLDTEFLYLNDKINASLRPQEPDPAYDTLCYKNTLWHFRGIMSEEDWMGQQCMQLLFRSPQNRIYRFSTGRLMSQANDTTYHPALPALCALHPIRECDVRLRGMECFLLINDERLLSADTVRLEKFVKVHIDSVTVGDELAPLRIWFTHTRGDKASVLTSLPDTRENATSTAINRYFSLTDPYLKYPNITSETWQLIQRNQVKIDMTLEEARLSMGKPLRYEHYNTKSGMIERWHYQDRKVLEFIDGRLRRVAIER